MLSIKENDPIKRIRKLAVVVGLLLLTATVVAISLDPYPVMPFIQEFIEDETIINFPIDHFQTAFTVLASLYLISLVLFYFYSWKGHRKAIAFLIACFIFDLALMVIEWKPSVNIEFVNFLINLNSFTDGLIVCTFFASAEKEN